MCQKVCQSKHQKECQIECQSICQKNDRQCQSICQLKCRIECQNIYIYIENYVKIACQCEDHSKKVNSLFFQRVHSSSTAGFTPFLPNVSQCPARQFFNKDLNSTRRILTFSVDWKLSLKLLVPATCAPHFTHLWKRLSMAKLRRNRKWWRRVRPLSFFASPFSLLSTHLPAWATWRWSSADSARTLLCFGVWPWTSLNRANESIVPKSQTKSLVKSHEDVLTPRSQHRNIVLEVSIVAQTHDE